MEVPYTKGLTGGEERGNEGGGRVFFGPISILPSLGCALIPNLSLLLCLEPFEKFLWMVSFLLGI